jgi:hypothetical protein
VVPVGAPGYGLSGIDVGEGAVWAATAAHNGGVVTRVDVDDGRPVGSVRVPYATAGVAAGNGAVWTAGSVCLGPHPDDPDVCVTEPRVSRIDPTTNRLAATISISRPPGVAPDSALVSAIDVGEDAVWVAVAWNSRVGEVVRVDPRTNEIAARIPTGGFTGELRVSDGSIWVLSHREYTDETDVDGASLLRIDPSSNEVAAAPIRDELTFLGGTQIPPVLAAGEDAVWVISPSAAEPRLAFRVDTETGEATRQRPRRDRFYPIAVERDTVWFIGTARKSFTLERLDSETLEPTRLTELPIYAVRAALDPATDTFWFASLVLRSNERPKLVRVELR